MRARKRAALTIGLAIGLAVAGAWLTQSARDVRSQDPRASAAAGAASAMDANDGPAKAGDRRTPAPASDPRPDPAHDPAHGVGVAASPERAPAIEPGALLAQEVPAATLQVFPRIVLEPLAVPPGVVTASLSGHDPGAPRELDLWAISAGRASPLGRASSDEGARIHAPQLPLPGAGLEVVATPRGVRPGEPGASAPLRLARTAASDAPAAGAEFPNHLPRWRRAPADGGEAK
jgi:hypothetical protein